MILMLRALLCLLAGPVLARRDRQRRERALAVEGRRADAHALRELGYDVVPDQFITEPESPVVRDTPWNHCCAQLLSMPGGDRVEAM